MGSWQALSPSSCLYWSHWGLQPQRHAGRTAGRAASSAGPCTTSRRWGSGMDMPKIKGCIPMGTINSLLSLIFIVLSLNSAPSSFSHLWWLCVSLRSTLALPLLLVFAQTLSLVPGGTSSPGDIGCPFWCKTPQTMHFHQGQICSHEGQHTAGL